MPPHLEHILFYFLLKYEAIWIIIFFPIDSFSTFLQNKT